MKATIILLATALAAACGSNEHGGGQDTRSAVHAKVVAVARAPVVDRYEAVGTVASKTSSPLASRIFGRVTAVRVREGDRVRAGQPLVEIEAREIAANAARARAGQSESKHALAAAESGVLAAEQAVAAARANRDFAEVTYERYKKLLEAKSCSPQEFDEVEARWKTAVAALASAESNVAMVRSRRAESVARVEQSAAESEGASVALGYATIVAPAAGIVTRKAVEVGTMAQPGLALLTVEDDGAYRLEASVEEGFASRVSVGASVPVRIDALGGLEVSGTVAEVAPSADPASRSVVVKIDLPPSPGLRSGQFGTAAFPAGERLGIAIPADAVVSRGQLSGVFVVDADGVARLRFVTLGKQVEGSAEVLSGLEEGERVATSNVERLTDGARVEAE